MPFGSTPVIHRLKVFSLTFLLYKKKLKHCLISCCCFDEAYLPLQNYQWKGLFHHNHSLYQLDPAGDPSDVCGAFHPENKANDISYEKQGINVLKSTKHKALEGQSFREFIVLLSWMLPWRWSRQLIKSFTQEWVLAATLCCSLNRNIPERCSPNTRFLQDWDLPNVSYLEMLCCSIF